MTSQNPNRICFWADESFADPTTRKFQVVRIEENEPGYWVYMEGFENVADAQAEAKRCNDVYGLTEKDVTDVRMSSMWAKQDKEADALLADSNTIVVPANRITVKHEPTTAADPNGESVRVTVPGPRGEVDVIVTFGEEDGVPLVFVDTDGVEEDEPNSTTVRINLNDFGLFGYPESAPIPTADEWLSTITRSTTDAEEN
jgi:hypothetical protein